MDATDGSGHDRSSACVQVPIVEQDDDRDQDGMVFMPQRSTHETLDLIHVSAFEASQFCSDGRLRDDRTPQLFSRQCFGLAVSAGIAGVVRTLFEAVFLPQFTTQYLESTHPHLVQRATSAFNWVPVVSVLIGLVSDNVELWGYRRKSYLLLGWLMGATMLSCVSAVSYVADLTQEFTADSLIVLGVLALVGVQVVWVVSLAKTVEHAQSETEQSRGYFHGAYFLVYYAAAAATQILVSTRVVQLDLREAAVALSCCTLVPIPFLVWFYSESADQAATHTDPQNEKSMAECLHQRPAYRIYFFLVGVLFLVNAHHSGANQSIMQWYGVQSPSDIEVLIAQSTPKVIAVMIWKAYMININWRVLGVFGLVLYSLCRAVLVLPYALDAGPYKALYYAWTAVAAVPLGWIEVFLAILPTEVASIGHEGFTMGLVSSFVALITLSSGTLWDSINDSLGWSITATSSATSERTTVVLTSVVYIAVNLSSTTLAPLLPPQKRVAQHWRFIESDADKPATRALIATFVLLLLYNATSSLLTIKL